MTSVRSLIRPQRIFWPPWPARPKFYVRKKCEVSKPLRFLVDEDLPRSLARLLVAHGYLAEDVRDIELKATPDLVLFQHAVEHRKTLISGGRYPRVGGTEGCRLERRRLGCAEAGDDVYAGFGGGVGDGHVAGHEGFAVGVDIEIAGAGQDLEGGPPGVAIADDDVGRTDGVFRGHGQVDP